jgi:hypothetical protein
LIFLESIAYFFFCLKTALEGRSSTLCEYSRVASILHTVGCDCGIGGGNDCFQSNTVGVPIAEGLPCAGLRETIGTATSEIQLNENSITSGCVSVVMSQVHS